MACEFRCSDCGGNGTRCDCHRKRPPIYRESWEEKRVRRIAELEAEVARNMAAFRRMNERKS